MSRANQAQPGRLSSPDGGVDHRQITAANGSGPHAASAVEAVRWTPPEIANPTNGLSLPAIRYVARGLHHVVVWHKVEGAFRRDLPVLYVFRGESRDAEPMLTLFDYTKAYATRSATWHLYRLRTIGALVDFVVQCGPNFLARGSDGRPTSPARNLFRTFVRAMVLGTINVENGEISDESGLYWTPSTVKEVERRVEALRDVARWLDSEGHGYALANTVLPEIPSEASGVLAFLYTSQVVKRISLLDYLSPLAKTAPARTRNLAGRPGSNIQPAYAFPENLIRGLLTYGFESDPSGRLNAMFQLGGGLRESEGFHLWLTDAQFVDGEAALFLFHPADAWITDPKGREVTRRQYLLETFNRVPRSDLLRDPEAAGWKGLRGDINGAHVHWLPGMGIGQAVAAAVKGYLKNVRDPIMKVRRHMGLPDHPYLLVSPRPMAGPNGWRVGDPYTMNAFRSSWDRAVKRVYRTEIGSIPDVVKRNGLTGHACRHRYAQRLVDLKLDGAVLQQCLRHVNPFSHLAYLQLPASKVNESLQAAAASLPDPDWGFRQFLSTSDALASERDRRHLLR